jgi:ribose transport system permease protein
MLTAIAAVFFCMTIHWDGQPKTMATFVGVIVIDVLDGGLTQIQVDSYVREVLVDVIILLALSISSLGRAAILRK